ncbi:hypothetical protein Daus18300_013690 [Diaporthe australafricana]|uniref:Uncharacterized protein n=1 Tax=Diaporthe australafricana TaxID=127596 RepID=A0ABR3VY23_9PEZI
MATELDDPASHLDALLGNPFTDADAESLRSSRHPDPDPDMESIRSLHSRTSHADSLLCRPLILDQTKRLPPPGPNKLHRRRNQYPNIDNRAVVVPESSSSHHETSHRQPQTHQQPQSRLQPTTDNITRSKSTRASQANTEYQQGQQNHRRAKSYTLSGGPSSWLINNSLVDVRRSGTWTGERREIRKLQKEHPAGSARPSMSVEISDGDGPPADGDKGSGLGVRRKMGRLRELYRK